MRLCAVGTTGIGVLFAVHVLEITVQQQLLMGCLMALAVALLDAQSCTELDVQHCAAVRLRRLHRHCCW